MLIGMMWLIDDPKLPLAESILSAARYYLKKFGRLPEMCLVNHKDVESGAADIKIEDAKIIVRPYKYILPRHLWIGVEDQKALIEDRFEES